jgi:DNA (cytosine-5)-methyltransferase 1
MQLDTKGSARTVFTFVDLFAGIGGIRLGLARVGGRCVYSCEIDAHARRTYEANFGPCEGHDVRAVSAHEIPDHDVLAAGFPCQPFSIAGVSKKLSLGREHGFKDEKSGNLFFEIVRIARAKRPAVVFLENVKNLRTHDGGRTMGVILRELDDAGYEMSVDVIDARHWVPQHRERTFLIGFRRDRYLGRAFVFPPIEPRVPAPLLRDILQPWFEPKYVLTQHLWAYLQQYRDKHRQRGNGFGYGLFGGDEVARTLSARYHKDGSEILIDTGSRLPRRLTPVECAALMGFPDPHVDRSAPKLETPVSQPLDSFVIPVSDTQAYRQFGNAVVVDVIEHLARALADQAGLQGAGIVEPLALTA